jgi:hypothetical protein
LLRSSGVQLLRTALVALITVRVRLPFSSAALCAVAA